MDNDLRRDYEDDFIEDLQNFEYNEMIEKARNIVLATAAGTGVTGALPIPFADAPIMIAEEVAMMVGINVVFKIEVQEDILKSLVMAALGTSGATFIGKTVVSNLLKMIPVAGTAVGAVVSGGTGALIAFLLGNAYIEVCKAIKMGKLSLDDLAKKKGKEAMKKAFEEQMSKKKKETGST
ncbi:MAG: DUF697 domain-containing protein [Clostridia bacterium]|nr:DUF697 domain-containing protein [Clostridia bacterium]